MSGFLNAFLKENFPIPKLHLSYRLMTPAGGQFFIGKVNKVKNIEFVTLPDNVQPEPSNFAPAGTANERRGQTTDGASGGSGNSWRHHQPTAAGPQRHQHRQPAGRKCWFIHNKYTSIQYMPSKTKSRYIFSILQFHFSYLNKKF